MKNKLLLVGLLISLLVGCSGEIDVEDEAGAEEVKQVLADNIMYLNNEDIDGYLSTLVERAHEATKVETETFFEEFDIEYELLSSKIVEEEDGKFVVEAEQKAQVNAELKSEEEFQDYISVNLHTFEKENGEWKISESAVVDINFID